MFCEQCGTQIEDGQRFCQKCVNDKNRFPKSISKKTILLLIAIVIGTIAFVISASVITYNIKDDGGKAQTIVTDPPSPYIGKRPIYSYYTGIGTITTRTKDDHSVSVVMNIGYDTTDETASSELSSKKFELQAFVQNYFAGKYASELQPENEARLKQDIKETLNKSFLETARVRIITFDKLDVMEK